ncbi:hypothetical protein MAR_001686 [Mya arenaria]|uniref:Uncharacterized protein n=1 Tax=Mya arenaria TaxID=6604 RepID=A0ABY7FCH4_MYAAR|nr:hypothetical protein MAR_001686 [Mya arenaria]
MFKTLSRWGSQVRSTLSVGFISNIFSKGGKGRKYGEINDETEEIFSDAHEELESDDEIIDEATHRAVIEAQLNVPPLSSTGTESTDTLKSNSVDQTDGSLNNLLDDKQTNGAEGFDEIRQRPEDANVGDINLNDVTVGDKLNESEDRVTEDGEKTDAEVNEASKANGFTKGTAGESDSSSENSDHGDSDDDHHEVHHDDTKKIVKSSGQNGTPKSSSKTMFQKVHRRVNSYTQRQYAKFDNGQDDENDRVISPVSDTADTKNVAANNVKADNEASKANGLTKSTASDSDNDSSSDDTDHGNSDDDHHEVHHDDTKKIVKSPGPNGIPKSSSKTMLQKVHRRVNSYSQRQYAKFDNGQDDENDNVISPVSDTADTNNGETNNVVETSLEQTDGDSSKKKQKKKKKAAKKARSAVRRSWKWVRRGWRMLAESQGFIVPSFMSAFQSTKA